MVSSRAGNLNQRIIPFYYKGKFVGHTARAINNDIQPKILEQYATRICI